MAGPNAAEAAFPAPGGWPGLPAAVRGSWEDALLQALPPASFGNVARLMGEELEPRQWCELASRDPVLGGKVLAVANSAAIGLRQRITDLERAVLHLGGNLLRVIVAGYYIEGLLGRFPHYPRAHVEFVRAWSEAAGVLAHGLARQAGLAEAGQLATAALLARLGSIALVLQWPPPDEAYRQLPDEVARLSFERERWRVTTPLLSGRLAAMWGLPSPLPELLDGQLDALQQPLPDSAWSRQQALLALALVLGAQHARGAPLEAEAALLRPENQRLAANLTALGLAGTALTAPAQERAARELRALSA
jgi:HD-like signal output (HDOD) protein